MARRHAPHDPVRDIRLAEGEIRFYRKEGYLCVPGLVAEDDAERLRSDVLHLAEKTGPGPAKFRQTSQYFEGTALDQYVNSPGLLHVAAQLMEGLSTLYRPFTAVKAAGGGRFHFHQDSNYTRFDGPGINLWLALEPMTPENGCLQVVPRSHVSGPLESVEADDQDGHRKVTPDPEDFVPLRLRAGDAVAFSRDTVHGSARNATTQPRVAYAVQFHRNDVRALVEGEWRLLTEHPRWKTKPVKELVPAAKAEIH